MRALAFVIALALAYASLQAWQQQEQTERDEVLEQAQKIIRDHTPDMIPPLAAKPIDQAASTRVGAIEPENFCITLGNALRQKSDPEFTRAMIYRADNEFASTLKFAHQSSIKSNRIQIGMTPCMAIAAWGKPERINRSVGSYGVHEQWVYPAEYLYFENDTLTSFQTQR